MDHFKKTEKNPIGNTLRNYIYLAGPSHLKSFGNLDVNKYLVNTAEFGYGNRLKFLVLGVFIK